MKCGKHLLVSEYYLLQLVKRRTKNQLFSLLLHCLLLLWWIRKDLRVLLATREEEGINIGGDKAPPSTDGEEDEYDLDDPIGPVIVGFGNVGLQRESIEGNNDKMDHHDNLSLSYEREGISEPHIGLRGGGGGGGGMSRDVMNGYAHTDSEGDEKSDNDIERQEETEEVKEKLRMQQKKKRDRKWMQE